MKHDKVSLLIHGPLSIYTAFMLYRYRDDFNIILSIPRIKDGKLESVLNEVELITKNKKYNISLLKYGEVQQQQFNNEQNKFLHFFSVSLGLQACTTEYVIKIRSDEFYSDLDPFIEAMYEHKSKLITSEVYFRNSKMPFHPSDHLVGGKLSLMKNIFNLARSFCEQETTIDKTVFAQYIKKTTDFIAAEQYVGICTLLYKFPNMELEDIDVVQLTKESFHIVKTKRLGMTLVSANSISPDRKEYFDSSFFTPESDVDDIGEFK